MPNGFHGNRKEWEEMEAPLMEIDTVLRNYASQNNMQFSKNYHGIPERSLVWVKDGVRRLIQIFMSDDKKRTFNWWLCASEDRGKKRFWKNEFLKKEVNFDEIKNNLDNLLEEGYRLLESWQKNDLELGSEISGEYPRQL